MFVEVFIGIGDMLFVFDFMVCRVELYIFFLLCMFGFDDGFLFICKVVV